MGWQLAQDHETCVTRGASPGSVIECDGIIQANDGYNGFNVKFVATSPGELPVEYHVHFKGALPSGRNNDYTGPKDQLSGKVKVVKVKNFGGNGPTFDRNIYKDNDGTDNLAKLASSLGQEWRYHKTLCENLGRAYNAWKQA